MGCNCNDGCGGSLTLPNGAAGTNGSNGAPGANGVSITNASVSGGNLVLTLDNGTTINAGSVVGPTGAAGTSASTSSIIQKYSYLESDVNLAGGGTHGITIQGSSISGSTAGALRSSEELNGSTVSSTDFVIQGFYSIMGIHGYTQWMGMPLVTSTSTLQDDHLGFNLTTIATNGSIAISINKSSLVGNQGSLTYSFKFIIIG